jgi:hypothetical protein
VASRNGLLEQNIAMGDGHVHKIFHMVVRVGARYAKPSHMIIDLNGVLEDCYKAFARVSCLLALPTVQSRSFGFRSAER